MEDHDDNRRLIAWILELEGFEVEEAGTGEEALDLARERRPDLILMDLELPGIDGWEVARRLSEAPSCPPIVAITAHAQEPFLERARAAGCVDVLTKPFLPEELPGRLLPFLRSAAPEASAGH